MVPDASAIKPDDWDEEEDGEWEGPLVENPNCKKGNCGEWMPTTDRAARRPASRALALDALVRAFPPQVSGSRR